MRAPRLTLVISSLGSGGAERVLTTLANAWADRGCAVTLVTLSEETSFYPLDPRVERQALGLVGTSRGSCAGVLANARRVRALKRAVLATEPDVVVSFLTETNVLTLLATRRLPVPVVVSERSCPGSAPLGRAWRSLRLKTYPRAAALVAQTTAALDWFPERIRRNGHVIPNPVVRRGAARPPAHPRHAGQVVSMGRLDRYKGFDLLLAAFAMVAPDFPDWSLTIWGEGPERQALEQQSHRLGLRDRVRMPGRTSLSDAAMRAGDLFVLASRFEGFPNVLCEAMACGLPVVSADCECGPRQIVRDGVDGLLVPPEDPDALAAGMARLMQSPEERGRLAARALSIVERFGLERVLGRWNSLFEQVCHA